MNLFVCKAVKPASRLRPAPAFKRLFTILVENGNLLRSESPELEDGLAAHFTDLQEDLPAEVAEKRRRTRRENHSLGRKSDWSFTGVLREIEKAVILVML
jgi:hypothetical protein